MSTDADDAGLVRATLSGDPVAFGELARRYRDAAFGVAFHRLGSFEAARDVAQEALVTAYTELPMLRDPSRFGRWLCRIATMAALTELRRRRPSLSLDAPDLDLPAPPESDPARGLERREKARQVREALALLPEPDRLAVILHYVNGYSHEEIGGMLGTTASGVKSRVHRARRRLRKEMLEMVESNLTAETASIELTEDLVRVALDRCPEQQWAILERLWAPFTLALTERSRKAVARVASELASEGYRWLVGPPHIPDGSPALAMLRDLGFTVETEMHWYERSLKGRLPAAPPLETGLAIRPLVDADADAAAALMQSALPQGSPVRFTADGVRAMLTLNRVVPEASRARSDGVVPEASRALYRGEQLAAFLLVLGNREANAKFEEDTAVIWWAFRNAAVAPPAALEHLIVSSLRPLKAAGYRRSVKEQLDPRWEHDRELIAVLQKAGFARVRSQWNMRLDLAAWQPPEGPSGALPAASGGPPARAMRPLAFAHEEYPVDTRYAQALQIRLDRILGTSPTVAPGEAYVASGEYTLADSVVPAITLACNGHSRGSLVGLAPGRHRFDVAAEILAVAPGKERRLYVNLMGVDTDPVVAVMIDLVGWADNSS